MRKLARLTIIFFCLYLSGCASAGQEAFGTCELIDAESLDSYLKHYIQIEHSFLESPVRTSLRVSREHILMSSIQRCDDRVFFIIKVVDSNGKVVDRLSIDHTVYQEIIFITPIIPVGRKIEGRQAYGPYSYDGRGVLLVYNEKGSTAFYWDELKSKIFHVPISE